MEMTTCDVCGKECSTLFSLKTNEGIIVFCSLKCFCKTIPYDIDPDEIEAKKKKKELRIAE